MDEKYKKFNYIALTAGILTILLIAASFFVPWWQLSIGNPAIAQANFSPVNYNFTLFNTMLTVPLIWAINLATLLTLLAGGIALLIYSIFPNKSFSKPLLGFGYKKPLYAVILFLLGLTVTYISITLFTGISFPLVGVSKLGLPSSIISTGLNISVSVTAGFGWTFFLSIVVVALCITARLYHRKIEPQDLAQPKPQTNADTPLPPPTSMNAPAGQ